MNTKFINIISVICIICGLWSCSDDNVNVKLKLSLSTTMRVLLTSPHVPSLSVCLRLTITQP